MDSESNHKFTWMISININEIYEKMKKICTSNELISYPLIEFQLVDEDKLRKETKEYISKLINNLNLIASDHVAVCDLIYDCVLEIVQLWFPLWDIKNVSWDVAYELDRSFFDILFDNIIFR